MSILRKLTKEDIGKPIIYCIFCDAIPKAYGEIVDFNDEIVFCRMKNSSKTVECAYEDLDFNDMDNILNDDSVFTGWEDLLNRFAENTRRKQRMQAEAAEKAKNQKPSKKKSVKKRRARKKK
jgi:hypothetical protein